MATIKIDNPTNPAPTTITDYENQNRILEQLMTNSIFYYEIENVTVNGGVNFCLQEGTFFDYNGIIHGISGHEHVHFATSEGKSILYLVFDGQSFSFTEFPPENSWDNIRQGYYNSGVKYLGVGLLQYNVAIQNQVKFYTPIVFEKSYLGQIYIRYPNFPPPHFFYYGKWEDVTADFQDDFFRVEGGDALGYDAGRQSYQLQSHTHGYAGNNNVGIGDGGSYSSPTATPAEKGIFSSSSGTIGNFGDVNEVRPINQSMKIYICKNERS